MFIAVTAKVTPAMKGVPSSVTETFSGHDTVHDIIRWMSDVLARTRAQKVVFNLRKIRGVTTSPKHFRGSTTPQCLWVEAAHRGGSKHFKKFRPSQKVEEIVMWVESMKTRGQVCLTIEECSKECQHTAD